MGRTLGRRFAQRSILCCTVFAALPTAPDAVRTAFPMVLRFPLVLCSAISAAAPAAMPSRTPVMKPFMLPFLLSSDGSMSSLAVKYPEMARNSIDK